MKYQRIDNLILFGGSRQMADFAPWAKKHLRYTLTAFCARRHLDEKPPGSRKTLRAIFKQHRIAYFEANNINHESKLKKHVTLATLGLVLGSAWIFDKNTAKLFRRGYLLDFNGIDVPRYRGGAHYTWQILHGNKKSTANLQVISGGPEDYQRGAVIKRLAYDLPQKARTPLDYYNFIGKQELKFLQDFFRELKRGQDFKPGELDESQSSYYPYLSTLSQGWINWGWSAGQIARFINAFDEPYAGAATYAAGKRVHLKDCQLLKAEENYHPFTAGLVVRKNRKYLYVAAVGGLLKIRNRLPAIKLGDRFYTPHDVLDEAMIMRAVYDGKGLKNERN